jgi:hypothetical protein
MTRLTASLLAASIAGFIALPASAADQPAAKKAPAKTAPAKKAAPKSAKKAVPAKEAEKAAPETLNDAQLEAAKRVITGEADCEFKQKVTVKAVPDQPGHFTLTFGKATYHMTPEETTTGAVRLQDRKQDVVWIQIPVKSMLLNRRVSQRMVDACQHGEQRAAVEAVEQAQVAATAAATAASAATVAASAAEAGGKVAAPANGGATAAQAAAQVAATAASTAATAASAAAQAASAALPGASASAPGASR